MATQRIRVGEKFPEEEKIQSIYSPGVVADEEVVERELRRSEEMSEAAGPTEAAFPRKQLLGRNGSGLSVNRLSDPEAGKKGLTAGSREAPSHARAGVSPVHDGGSSDLVSCITLTREPRGVNNRGWTACPGASRPWHRRRLP